MVLFDLLLHTGLVTTAIVAYLIFFRRSTPIILKGNYRQPGWNYYFRLMIARYAVKRWKNKNIFTYILETPTSSQRQGSEYISVRATAPDGTALYLGVRKVSARAHAPRAEATVYVRLHDGTTYKLPQHPETLTGPWENIEFGWSVGGLKIEVLGDEQRLRIIYNGLLKRDSDGLVQHVKFNFLWSSASKRWEYPREWSNELAAQALALEPWRDGNWPSILDNHSELGWIQWGTVQGRFEAYTSEGAAAVSEYVRARGVRERRGVARGAAAARRGLTLTAIARDGTALVLRAFSYKHVLTLGYSGCVRYPDYSVHSITGTDLVLDNFCEHPDPDVIPKAYTINVTSNRGSLTVVLRISGEGGELLSGAPYLQRTLYRAVSADINGYVGSGLLELDYLTNTPAPPVPTPPVSLRWATALTVGSVGYCVSLEEPAAACPAYVGGKGASLALLTSAQETLGYKVPPGYCLTTRALDKHLEANPNITAAIREIEAVNENYDDSTFREKCNRVVDLFAKTEIVSEVREEIVSQLALLRKKAIAQSLGPEVRFAVRSSAIGEDSEALSAAGQNETVLGAASDQDVVRAVQLCWGSMFAFNSAHYRRQNGQRCLCSGGVVVQALVRARAAGVMFTRHPAAGDPARLLLTANYGLGETVVSGSVEPDSIIVSRGEKLTIAKIEVGSKKQRVIAAGAGAGAGADAGVATEDVSEAESALPCVSAAEILALAGVGVAQEEAWGAGRDIEWAVTEEGIYLLQARPITSLQRWSEQELLHELDTPVMSDDDLFTFANTGEVLPKPLTALSYDCMYTPLASAMNSLFDADPEGYDRNLAVTHLRVCMSLYNGLFRIPPAKMDLLTRLMSLSITTNPLADENVLSIAQHRRQVKWWMRLSQLVMPIKFLIMSKFAKDSVIKIAKTLELNLDIQDPMALLESILAKEDQLYKASIDHGTTSGASSLSQFIAMLVLAEGHDDFTQEQCNEVNVLLSSGDVLSAEVPARLAGMARALRRSGRAHEFRAQPPRAALPWLMRHLPHVYRDVIDFLEVHGHRAVMEFDYSTKPWVLVPHEMMKVLQNMDVPDEEETRTEKSDEQIIASLKTPKKSSTRKILRWLLPVCRATVRHREITKSNLCLTIHKLRLGFIQLGKLMVKEWYLPDEDLVFHFRLHELSSYLLTRDPVLLRKASQRLQYRASWSKLRFAELHTGWVEPEKSRVPKLASGDVTVTGTVVCGGEVVARACSIKELSEIDQLQRGDILITHSTDIGWSPYFPLLSGIVTELGGLISHGAVIAREYGLPCIVGAKDATEVFRTGDTVRLAAAAGLLERVTLAAEQNTEGVDKLS